jgi:hypothetical protein
MFAALVILSPTDLNAAIAVCSCGLAIEDLLSFALPTYTSDSQKINVSSGSSQNAGKCYTSASHKRPIVGYRIALTSSLCMGKGREMGTDNLPLPSLFSKDQGGSAAKNLTERPFTLLMEGTACVPLSPGKLTATWSQGPA